MQLCDIQVGESVQIGDVRYIVLSQSVGKTAVITERIQEKMAYGETGEYIDSSIRRYCIDDFYRKVLHDIGAENILPHFVDLQAEDGTGIDKSCYDFVSVLTKSRYRRYRQYLPPLGDWWWLSTRVSYDDSLGFQRRACCVYSNGIPDWGDCGYRGGVRPFLVLKSDLLIS